MLRWVRRGPNNRTRLPPGDIEEPEALPRAGTSRGACDGRVGECIASMWRGGDHPELAELYLASRGINMRPKPLPAAIRGQHRVRCTDDHGKYRPAVLAAVSDASGG